MSSKEERLAWFDLYTKRLEEALNSTAFEKQADQNRCPCCHYLTLGQRSQFDICPVCFWEDDGQDDPHADEVWGGPNGNLSLTQARQNYLEFGASLERRLQHVRPPQPEEI